MSKICVFCGNLPERKNKEHIIPKWLIELTGNPNRLVQFGPIWNSKTLELEFGEFAFDQFQFPACEKCNSEHSHLEVKAKEVLQQLLNEKPLSSEDLSILLDWLDKIRIGLWLAYNYLQKNLSSVEPNYYISNRIGETDRAVFIYKSDYEKAGISFSGANTPAFQYRPVCYNLRINQFCFFNLSTDFLISKGLGFPYAKEIYFTESQEMEYLLKKGRDNVSFPLVRSSYNKKCTEIYQPIFSHYGRREQIAYLYETPHVKSMSQDFDSGVGKILIKVDNQVKEYPSNKSNSWIPKVTWDLSELMDVVGEQVLNSQIYYLNRGGNYNKVSTEKKNLIKEQHKIAKQINRLFLDNLIKS